MFTEWRKCCDIDEVSWLWGAMLFSITTLHPFAFDLLSDPQQTPPTLTIPYLPLSLASPNPHPPSGLYNMNAFWCFSLFTVINFTGKCNIVAVLLIHCLVTCIYLFISFANIINKLSVITVMDQCVLEISFFEANKLNSLLQ